MVRLLRLLGVLQQRPEWSGRELAARLEVSPRTVRRDVERLRGLGYPVVSTTGTAGGYRLARGAVLPPLHLDDDEAVAVALGLRLVTTGTVSGMAEASVTAVAKLERVMPERLRRRVGALAGATVVLRSAGPSVASQLLSDLATACRDTRLLRLRYRDREGTPSQRVVEPYRLVHTGRRWYLLAYDTGRQDWRTLRVDRVEEVTAPGGGFVPRDVPDAARTVVEAVSTSVYRYRAVVEVSAAAEVVRAQVPAAAGVVEPAGPESCLLRTGADSLTDLVAHLTMLGVPVRAREPEELVHALDRAAACLRQRR